MPHLALERVGFAHPGGKTVLHDADFAAEAGSFSVLRGPSGAGKSTLLRLLCRLEEPQEGRVLLAGEDIRALAPATLRRRVAYLQQTPTVVAGSVRENLLLPYAFRANAGLPRPDDARLAELLGRLGAADIPLSQEAGTLSVGQRQRLCLVRAMLSGPEALLLDEPTSALDPDSAAAVLGAAEDLCLDAGVTVLLVSHTDFTPRRVRPRNLRLEGGNLTQEAAWTPA
jgi:putative ABC transport system ATP-binding protein